MKGSSYKTFGLTQKLFNTEQVWMSGFAVCSELQI